MKSDSPKVMSRRSRPSKAPLSREKIVLTALDIIAKDGINGLSLRRVATALDTGAASLYVYLDNLNELYALMLDQALADVELPQDSRASWRKRLKSVLHSYVQVLFERNGLAQLALSTIATGPNSLRIWEALLGLLKEGGVEDAKAAWGIDLLTLHATAIAAEKSNWRATNPQFGRVKKALEAAPAEQFPLIVALKQAILAGDEENRLNWTLDVLIDGIVSHPRAATR